MRETTLRRRRKNVLICVFLAMVFAAKVFSQDVKPLGLEQALGAVGFAELMGIEFSPLGNWLAYTTKDYRRARTVDLEAWARSGIRDAFTGTDIWIVDVHSGAASCLTGGKGDNFLPTWSPDGNYLAFVSDRDGSSQANLWIWDATRGQIRKISDLRIRQFGQIEWTPDSAQIVAPVIPDQLPLEDYVRRFASDSGTQSLSSKKKVASSSAAIYGSSDRGGSDSEPWNLDFWRRDLVSIDVSTGKFVTLVHDKRIAHFSLSSTGLQLGYTTPKRFEKPGSQQTIYDLEILNLSNFSTKIVASDIPLDFDGTFSWSPNGSLLAFRRFGPEERVFDCYVVGLDNQQPRNITNLRAQPQWPRHTNANVLWDPMSEAIYFTTNGTLWRAPLVGGNAKQIAEIADHQISALIPASHNSLWIVDGGRSTVVVAHDEEKKRDGFYKLDLQSGKSSKLLESDQCYTCVNLNQPFAVTQDKTHLAYFAEDAQRSADLWLSDSQFSSRKPLTHLNPQLEDSKPGTARLVSWLSDDGELLHGALLLPSNYEAGKRYPLVVWIYGGASLSNDFNHFGFEGPGPFNMQLLATRGYAVLAPDSRERLGTPMLDLVKTVLPGVNRIVEMGVADPDRLAIMGHSHGGYDAIALTVQTKRFKAAVMIDGLADLMANYGEMDKTGASFGISIAEFGQGMMGGTPWQFRDRYIENSPIFYLDRVDTPILILQGAEDTTVPPFLSDEVFVGLRRLGKPVEYAKYDGEGHSPVYWSLANQLDFCNRVLAWFDTYLKQSPLPKR